MQSKVSIKVCGITDDYSASAAVTHGADFLGFVFYKSSPRYVSAKMAAEISEVVPDTVSKVALFVNPTDSELEQTLGFFRADYIQLHGNESPDRVDSIRWNFGLPVLKAIAVSSKKDIIASYSYHDHADMLLFDSKPPLHSTRPGGNALTFNWGLMSSYEGKLPWFLAGGLNSSNVARALSDSSASAVDVSSAVESVLGQKDPSLIANFIEAVKNVND
jgi:phosphoribosylanthranilate isomerase